jgi:hypothetical protein
MWVMTFRELMVMVRLYRAAPPDLRRWADGQLPDLADVVELVEENREHTGDSNVHD